jgi:hypothetical protein
MSQYYTIVTIFSSVRDLFQRNSRSVPFWESVPSIHKLCFGEAGLAHGRFLERVIREDGLKYEHTCSCTGRDLNV